MWQKDEEKTYEKVSHFPFIILIPGRCLFLQGNYNAYGISIWDPPGDRRGSVNYLGGNAKGLRPSSRRDILGGV